MNTTLRAPVSSNPPSPKIVEFEPLLDSDEAAALLKIHPKTLQRMARERTIDGIQIGRLWRFRASSIDEFLRRKRVA